MNVNVETLIGLVRSAFNEGRTCGCLPPEDPAAAEKAWQKSEAHGFLEELVLDQAKAKGNKKEWKKL